jgi:hypothetical protein
MQEVLLKSIFFFMAGVISWCHVLNVNNYLLRTHQQRELDNFEKAGGV